MVLMTPADAETGSGMANRLDADRDDDRADEDTSNDEDEEDENDADVREAGSGREKAKEGTA